MNECLYDDRISAGEVVDPAAAGAGLMIRSAGRREVLWKLGAVCAGTACIRPEWSLAAGVPGDKPLAEYRLICAADPGTLNPSNHNITEEKRFGYHRFSEGEPAAKCSCGGWLYELSSADGPPANAGTTLSLSS